MHPNRSPSAVLPTVGTIAENSENVNALKCPPIPKKTKNIITNPMKHLKLVTPAAFLFLYLTPALRATVTPSAYSDADLSLTSVFQSETATASATAGASFAKSQANPGLLQNSLLATAAGGALSSFETESVSSFSDSMTISNPLYTGQPGTLAFSFLLTGADAFSAVLPGKSSLTLAATVTGLAAPDTLTFTTDSLGVTSGTPFLGTSESFNIPFTFGTPFKFGLEIDLTGLVSNLSPGASALTTGTFSTTASTGAVTALVLNVPHLVTNFTARTASGVNYAPSIQTLPIPEPAPIPLIAASLFALVPFLRRRRHSPAP
jgi:hypothetical protein